MSKPIDNKEITLQELAELYDTNLSGKIFIYDVKHKNTPFRIKFDQGHLAHLIALHKFGYKKGESLFPQLLDGTITLEILEARNKGAFKEHKYRILHFQYILDILNSTKIAIFDSQKNGSVIGAEFIFYNEISKRFLSLAIRKENNTSDYYVPVTFLDSKKNKWQSNKHIVAKSLEIQVQN